LKLTRSGGLFPSRDQWGLARAAGLPMLVSGLTDSLLTKLAACQFAAAFGCSGPAALNGSQFTDEDELFPTKSTIESGGTVTLPATAGLGVEPDEAALQKYAVE
jgi:muconate cycloisomerase